ncbi:MAG TPA: LysR family transcriptional regulator [Myxococcota bacterium]|nr:LysR family transcriptional regulator [Myxococcota bacterium]
MHSADIKNVDLNLLVALDVLLEERNASRAARRLGLTQSTVSGMLARLRDALGDPLFVRARYGLRPTPRADALAAPLRRWLEDARALVAPAEFDPARWRGAVAISSTDYMQESLLVPFARALGKRAPELRVALSPLVVDGLAERLAAGALDLAVTIPEFAPPDLPSRRLYRDRYVVAVRRTHPLAKRRRFGLDELCRFDHVVVSPTGGAFAGPTDAALARAGRQRRVRTSVPTFLLVPRMLEAEDLVAVLPERLVAARAPRLRALVPPLELPAIDVIAVWHPRVQRDPAHRWLREQLVETATRLG